MRRLVLAAATVALLAPLVVNATDSTSTSFRVSNPVVEPGASYSASTSYRLNATIGQPAQGASLSTSYRLKSGFLYFTTPSSGSSSSTPGAAWPPGKPLPITDPSSVASAAPIPQQKPPASPEPSTTSFKRDLDAERTAIRTFTRLFPRVPKSVGDWRAVNYLAYGGTRPERSLTAETRAVARFVRIFRRLPRDTNDWRAVHVLAYPALSTS
ncbi:hypothetical protein L6Q96_04895 [Candidatus Binatia bacterium]|nr:hypothetical protein [Candidatus Binatia bacterium]